MTDAVEKIAHAVLYEGYVLWPYRRSSIKNRQRWTFGGVYPRAFSEANDGHDPWFMQTQCLVAGLDPVVSITVRFLHIVDRQVFERTATGRVRPVDELRVGTERYLTWEEAVEREFSLDEIRLADTSHPRTRTIQIPAGSDEQGLTDGEGNTAGMIGRSWRAIDARIEAAADQVAPAEYRLTVRIANLADWDGQSREETLRRTPISTHTTLSVSAGEFRSMTDPPSDVEQLVRACENIKTWPVLVGETGATDMMLSSPIILYDYPEIAPESPGDLFDSTEIDQLLVLNILSLTDDEKEEMRASDPKARRILERTEALTNDEIMNLHGATREFRMLSDESEFPTLTETPDFSALMEGLETDPPSSLLIDGVSVERGSRVVLRPNPGGDVFDIALAGKVGIVEGIEQDYEERVFLTVTVEDDPGRDLGQEKMMGHRFFFKPEEIEPIGDRDAGELK